VRECILASVERWLTPNYTDLLPVNIPRKRYYTGDKIEMHVEIHNMTDKKIKILTCTLIKKSTSYVLSQGLRNVNSKKDVRRRPSSKGTEFSHSPMVHGRRR
jgi:hypothetical protein